MTTVGQVAITASVSGGPSGQRTFTGTIVITAGVDQTSVLSLSSGANTVTIPTGTTAMLIAPPNSTSPAPNPSYTGVLTVKGVSGDTGVAISNKWPTLLAFDTSPSTVVINASVSGTVEIAFF